MCELALFGRGRPAAHYFLCLCKESNQRKHTLLPPKSPASTRIHGRLANSPLRGSNTLADFPRGFGYWQAASEGEKASLRDGLSPSEPPRLGASFGGFRRVCLSPGAARASYAAARSLHPGEGTRRAAKRGGLLLVTFLGQARKVTRCRATPGQTPLAHQQH